jgi:protein-S-isoprenylcysteine O-methyltransferase Ste14
MADPIEARDRPIGEALRSAFVGTAIVAALLLVPAGLVPGGTWLWPHGLVFVGAYGVILAAGNTVLAAWRPDHFRVRQQGVVATGDKRQPRLDALGSAAFLGFLVAWVAFIPIDVFRLHLLPAPGAGISWAGGIAAVIGVSLTPIAVWENRFAAPNVQDQTAQDQRIVDTGVYSLVRHPIYLGNLLMSGGAALWLESWAAFLGVGLVLLATVGRIAIEEKHLRANFPAYGDYAKRVRGRLIPFLL